ncbi:hypothetical protein [Ramlibacter agri]|uniref:hypothetical protein n=1 Tax=Ramlibacter agri TaxID=2728837 RepID=UPI0019825524|nr:hypothetical protein [Ramlibacter agri]
MDTNILAVIAVVVLLLVIAGLLLTRKRRSENLHGQFGPEYERTVGAMGSRGKAEAELLARKKRVDKLQIVPLSPQEAERFRIDWERLQSRFVDNPQAALAEADLLVRDLMTLRGYPMGDFESRAADISVDHPHVVEQYRAAHAIALRDREGQADTEALRQAIVHYRALFAELLEVAETRRAVVREPVPMPTRRGFDVSPERAMASEKVERERRSER